MSFAPAKRDRKSADTLGTYFAKCYKTAAGKSLRGLQTFLVPEAGMPKPKPTGPNSSKGTERAPVPDTEKEVIIDALKRGFRSLACAYKIDDQDIFRAVE